ncbi:MAG TPA: DUF4157 domain-containing protein [Burkholderiaceae bacterium]|nr:DUF4157 domain-containing protein [Burkholderiaceae bacterium]
MAADAGMRPREHTLRLHRSVNQGSAPVHAAPVLVQGVLSSPGRPLAGPTRDLFEAGFGHDFSQVQVHADAAAAASAHAVGAHAYTVGSHIVFGAGKYSPQTTDGRQLLAHELAHTLQQSEAHSVDTASALSISQPDDVQEREAEASAQRVVAGQAAHIASRTGPMVARQLDSALRVPLSWDELFNKVISDQRAFMFTGPTEVSNPTIDPAGVGRGVGPDRTMRGREVLAAIQIVDRDGNRRAIGFGAHALLPGGHGEEQALAGLRQALPPDVDVSGGKMMVVVDQYPCGPDRHDCGLQLRRFAEERGLALEVKVPLRENVNRPGVAVSPRTASRGAYRTDLAADPRTRVRLVTIDSTELPGGGSGPSGTRPGGGGAAPARPGAAIAKPAAFGSATRPETSSEIISGQRLVAQLEAEALESRRFAVRVKVYSAVFGAFMEAISILDTINDAMAMQSEGTLLGPSQRQADQVASQAREAKAQAEKMTDDISLLSAVAAVSQAMDRNDEPTLMNLSGALGDLSMPLGEQASKLDDFARSLDARAKGLAIAGSFHKTLAQIPQGLGTAGNAHAFGMYVSLERLSNAVRSGAADYAAAAELLAFYANTLGALAHEANQAAWELISVQIIRAQHELDAAKPATPKPATPIGTLRSPPTPQGFPRLDEQRAADCPNCHRPNRSPMSDPERKLGGLGSGPGGQMTPEDLRKLKEWIDGSAGAQR